MYSSNFHLLGFDILIDQKCKPWLIEVNGLPSFNGDTHVDRLVKKQLIYDTFKLINIESK